MEDLQRRAERLAEALFQVDAALDWDLLGNLYCHEGGAHFFPEEQREAIRDAGLAFSADLGEVLTPGGASHYVGAAVAELPLLLFETVVLERRVHWTQLPSPEFDELARVMDAVGGPTPSSAEAPPFPVDHLWFVSVLTDPDAFPGLHDELYERDTGAAAGGSGLEQERARAARLVDRALGGISPPATLTTTDEEAPFFHGACERRGWSLTFPERGRLSGIVGDVVRHGTVLAEGR